MIERQCASLYTQKGKQLRNVFMYKKPDTFQKARPFMLRFNIQKAIHLMLQEFHEIFDVGIYIQKTLHFALSGVLYAKS